MALAGNTGIVDPSAAPANGSSHSQMARLPQLGLRKGPTGSLCLLGYALPSWPHIHTNPTWPAAQRSLPYPAKHLERKAGAWRGLTPSGHRNQCHSVLQCSAQRASLRNHGIDVKITEVRFPTSGFLSHPFVRHQLPFDFMRKPFLTVPLILRPLSHSRCAFQSSLQAQGLFLLHKKEQDYSKGGCAAVCQKQLSLSLSASSRSFCGAVEGIPDYGYAGRALSH